MKTLKEAAQQALEFVEHHSKYWNGSGEHPQVIVHNLRTALAAEGEAKPAIQTGWKRISEQFPPYDEHARIICYTEGNDFAGEQFFDVPASDFHLAQYEDGSGEQGTEVTRCVSHWILRDALMSAIAAPQPAEREQAAQHPDDAAVDRFAAAMKAKLAASRAKGRSGWDDPEQCSMQYLSDLLRGHVEKGDPVDVGNFAMMLHQRGSGILAALQPSQPQGEYPPPLTDVLKHCMDALEHIKNAAMDITVERHVISGFAQAAFNAAKALADDEGAPRHEVELTDEQIDKLADIHLTSDVDYDPGDPEPFSYVEGANKFARAVIAADRAARRGTA